MSIWVVYTLIEWNQYSMQCLYLVQPVFPISQEIGVPDYVILTVI